jgi:hypothetical protein
MTSITAGLDRYRQAACTERRRQELFPLLVMARAVQALVDLFNRDGFGQPGEPPQIVRADASCTSLGYPACNPFTNSVARSGHFRYHGP